VTKCSEREYVEHTDGMTAYHRRLADITAGPHHCQLQQQQQWRYVNVTSGRRVWSVADPRIGGRG